MSASARGREAVENYAEYIGEDAYASDAVQAVQIIQDVLAHIEDTGDADLAQWVIDEALS